MVDCVVRVDTRSLQGCDGRGGREKEGPKVMVAINKYFFWRSPVATGDWSTDWRGQVQGWHFSNQAGKSGVTNNMGKAHCWCRGSESGTGQCLPESRQVILETETRCSSPS